MVGYGLDDRGFESGGGKSFSQTSKPALGHTHLPVQSSSGVSGSVPVLSLYAFCGVLSGQFRSEMVK